MGGDFLDNWATQLRKGVLEFCILQVIARGDTHGYDIVRTLRGIEGLMIAEGTVYPLLSRLRREGLIVSTIVESPQGPPRRCYRLTDKGAEIIRTMDRSWLALARGVEQLRKGTHHG